MTKKPTERPSEARRRAARAKPSGDAPSRRGDGGAKDSEANPFEGYDEKAREAFFIASFSGFVPDDLREFRAARDTWENIEIAKDAYQRAKRAGWPENEVETGRAAFDEAARLFVSAPNLSNLLGRNLAGSLTEGGEAVREGEKIPLRKALLRRLRRIFDLTRGRKREPDARVAEFLAERDRLRADGNPKPEQEAADTVAAKWETSPAAIRRAARPSNRKG